MSDTVDDDVRSNADVNPEDLRDLLAKSRANESKARQQASQEAQRRAEAERERDEARGAVTSESDRRWQAEEQALESAMSANQSEADSLEAQIAAAYEAGNHAEAAKISRRLARVEGQIALTEQKKTWLTDAREAAKQQAAQAPAQRSSAPDLSQYHPKQRAWIENDHPEYLTDPKFRTRVAAAHFAALAEDLTENSDEYFDYINAAIAPKQPQQAREEPEEASVRREREPSATVPVSRRAQGGPPRAAVDRLSSDEREVADFTMGQIPIDAYVDASGQRKPGRYEHYANQRARLKAQGRL